MAYHRPDRFTFIASGGGSQATGMTALEIRDVIPAKQSINPSTLAPPVGSLCDRTR